MKTLNHIILLATFSLTASACAADVDSFAENASRHLCTNYEECTKAVFDEVYNDDRGKCRDETEANILAAARDCEDRGCSYDEEAASDCYKAIRKHKRDCNVGAAVFDRCNQIYSCPDDVWCSLAGIGTTDDQRSETAAGNPLIPHCASDELDFEGWASGREDLGADEYDLGEYDPDAEAPADAGTHD